MKVVYGHTDSIYCTVDSVEQAKEACNHINNEVQKIFPNVFNLEEHPVQLEFEKYFRSLGVGATKNRNAGLVSWKDGKDLDEDEFVMTGFTAKRISETKLAKDVQIEVLNMWVNSVENEEIVTYLNDLYTKVLSGSDDIEVSSLLKRTRWKDERFKAKCQNCKRTVGFIVTTTASKCCNKPQLTTLENKRISIREGVEGVCHQNYFKQIHQNDGVTGHDGSGSFNSNLIMDSYFFVRVRGEHFSRYIHPITKEMKQTSYISADNAFDLENMGRHKIDWNFYADTVKKKAEPIFLAMGWDTDEIGRDTRQTGIGDWI